MSVSSLSDPEFLSVEPALARRQLRGLMEDAHWSGDVDAVLLAVHEAMVNSQRHGGGATRVCAGMEGRALEVEVYDRGPGFDFAPDRLGSPDPTAERGRGLWLISRIASRCRVLRRSDGNCLRLRFDPA